jgi:hypothetical protein
MHSSRELTGQAPEAVMVTWTMVFKKVDLIQHLFAKRCVGTVRSDQSKFSCMADNSYNARHED